MALKRKRYVYMAILNTDSEEVFLKFVEVLILPFPDKYRTK